MPDPLPADTRSMLRVLAPDLSPAAALDLYSPGGSRLYERFGATDTSEIAALTAAVRRTSGPILELACGGGRLAVPLLALGRPVVGLDLSETMVSILRERLAALPPTRVPDGCVAVQGDMSDFELDRRFGAIVLASTSISLLDEAGRRRLYAAVARHLQPGGRFFVTTIADAHSLPRVCETRVIDAEPGAVAFLSQVVSADRRRRAVAVLHLVLGSDGVIAPRLYRSDVHIIDSALLRAEARAAGLRVVASAAEPDAAGTILHEVVLS